MKFFDLREQQKKISKNLNKEIRKNFLNGDFIQGDNVKTLEKKLLRFTNSDYCLTCANGTDAIKIALKSLNIKKNSYVIVPSYTWISTASSVVEAGLKPFFCDVNIDTFLIDISKLKNAIKFAKQKKIQIKALITVDLFGNPVDYKRINKICKKQNIYFISDAAQSFGSKINKKFIGTDHCDVMTTSFFPTKTLGCYGDGGAIFFKNKELYDKAKIFSKNGQGKLDLVSSGINSRLDTIQATILLEKIKFFKKECDLRKRIYDYYKRKLNKKIADVQKIKLKNNSGHSVMTIKLHKNLNREVVTKYLNQNDIPTKIYYSPPLHQTKFYSSFPHPKLVNTEYLSRQNFSLPIYPYISLKSVKKICSFINKLKNK